MFTIYVIYNKEKSKIYIGQTNDIDKRLRSHNEGTFKNSYTSRYKGKWILIYKEVVESRVEVLKREKQLKSFRGRQSIKQYIPL